MRETETLLDLSRRLLYFMSPAALCHAHNNGSSQALLTANDGRIRTQNKRKLPVMCREARY